MTIYMMVVLIYTPVINAPRRVRSARVELLSRTLLFDLNSRLEAFLLNLIP